LILCVFFGPFAITGAARLHVWQTTEPAELSQPQSEAYKLETALMQAEVIWSHAIAKQKAALACAREAELR